jgi:citrate synthase
MADHEMLNLEEMGNLKDSMELLGDQPESVCRI